jgi:type I restriction enzyme M protein
MAKETTTIIKKILPYLVRLGYSIQNDLFFEEQVKTKGKVIGFTDIEIQIEGKLLFLLEAKRDSQKINDTHREQAINYGVEKQVPFVSVTNGQTFELWNVKNRGQITINGERNIFPPKKDLPSVLDTLKKNSDQNEITITALGKSYAPGVTLAELTNIFKRCHNAIRDIEKDDEHAFSDFSKFLFLKLLEEKADEEQSDPEGFRLPYSLSFENIRDLPDDALKASIHEMFVSVQKDKKYGEVLEGDNFYIQNSKTFAKIVKELAPISLSDSDVDVKGTAFEYFLKFNLKGSQLGQYFTPRELVRLMIELVDLKSIVLGLIDPKKNYLVIDPACGSGGFLITGMQRLIQQAREFLKDGTVDEDTFKTVRHRAKKEVFFGCDAKHMLARTAKMNMIIAGDGFVNIKHGNSLTEEVPFLQISDKRTFPLANFVLANPPFGMSESELDSHSLELYDIHTTRGQALFLQKMIRITQPKGLICTVIDEGILNTQSMIEIRQHILQKCFLEAVIHLPYVTFEPNYARVSTSVLLLRKKELETDKQTYPIFMYDLKEIGYSGSGKPKGKASDEITKDLVEKYRAFKNEHH